MHTQNFIINDCSHGQTVEALCKMLPKTHTETPFAFIIEPIYSVDGSAFMVSAEEEKVVWVLDFVQEEEAYCLYTLFSSVYIVSKK